MVSFCLICQLIRCNSPSLPLYRTAIYRGTFPGSAASGYRIHSKISKVVHHPIFNPIFTHKVVTNPKFTPKNIPKVVTTYQISNTISIIKCPSHIVFNITSISRLALLAQNQYAIHNRYNAIIPSYHQN